MYRANVRMGKSLFGAWVLLIIKECVRDRGHLTLRTKHPTKPGFAKPAARA